MGTIPAGPDRPRGASLLGSVTPTTARGDRRPPTIRHTPRCIGSMTRPFRNDLAARRPVLQLRRRGRPVSVGAAPDGRRVMRAAISRWGAESVVTLGRSTVRCMTTRAIVLFAIGLGGCTRDSRNAPAGAVDLSIDLIGATVTPPRDSGWALVRSDKAGVIFEKREGASTARISARTFQIDSVTGDSAFFAFAEARRQQELHSLARVSFHLDHKRFKGTACLRYDGIFRDTLNVTPDRPFLNTMGYICWHPGNAHEALHLDLSQLSASKSLSGSAEDAAQALFESARFTDHGLTP
jgi:hypothetical protein